MKGVYLVFFRLETGKEIEIGALGELEFDEGIYVYTGSARNSLEKRVGRHFSEVEKRFWHIDYFSAEASTFDYFLLPEKSGHECVMAQILGEMGEPVEDFGCSDCGCTSHLFRFEIS